MDFELIVAPDANGKASGQLYMDDGESITPPSSTSVKFAFGNGRLDVSGQFGFPTGVNVARVRFLGVKESPSHITLSGKAVNRANISFDKSNKVLDVVVGISFAKAFSVSFSS